MPMTWSNNTKPKPHIKLDAESADPPRMQCGQAEVQAERLGSNVPSDNPPDPRMWGQLLANVVAPGHSLANGDDTSLPAITGTRKRGRKLTKMIINEPDEDPASKRAKSGMGEASQSSKKGKAKVAAEHEAKKQAMEEKIREGERAKEFLALMNINEDLKMKNYSLKTHNAYLQQFASMEEHVLMIVMVKARLGPAKMKGKTVRKPKKAAKGELCGNIKAKEMRLRGKEDDSGREVINKAVNVCFTAFDSAPKNYQNAGLGGLDDEDIISTGLHSLVPIMWLSQRLCTLQIFNLVEVVAKSDSSSIPVTVKNSKVWKATKLQHTTQKEDPKADMDLGMDHPTAAKFLHDLCWVNVFILTITHALYISWEPFLNFASESPMFLTTVQKIFNLSFPNVDLVLASDDPLVVTVWIFHHIFQKSKLASGILEAITKFFNCDMFINQPEKIQDHIHWAIKGDGPAYYKTPTLKNSNVAHDDPCY
ncbi:hypothetical protein BJV74DRAFT_891454 [Russula compacta]|nr:hypothetical protein BJV74DRAFT_891454 [Russula compacta]